MLPARNGTALLIVLVSKLLVPCLLTADPVTVTRPAKTYGHGRLITSQYAPDGSYVATVQTTGIILWNPETGEKIRTLNAPNRTPRSIAISSDSDLILTGFYEKSAALWNSRTGELIRQFKGHDDAVRSVAISPDNKKAITASSELVIIWELETGVKIRDHTNEEVDISYPRNINQVAFVLEGGSYLVGIGGHLVRHFDLETGENIRIFYRCDFDGCWDRDLDFAVTPDGENVLINFSSGKNFIDLETGSKVVDVPNTLGAPVFSNDASKVLFGVYLYNTSTWERIRQFDFSPESPYLPYLPSFSPNDSKILFGSNIFDTETGELIRELPIDELVVNWAKFTPDGNFLIVKGNRIVRMLETNTGNTVHQFPGIDSFIRCIKISQNGKELLVAYRNSMILFSTETGKRLQHFNSIAARNVRIIPNSQLIFVEEYGNLSTFFNKQTGDPVFSITTFASDFSVAADGSKISFRTRESEDSESFSKVIDVPGFNELYRIPERYTQFSPDGKFLLARDLNGVFTMYNANSGEHVYTLDAGNSFTGAFYSPTENDYLTLERESNLLKMWEGETGRLVYEIDCTPYLNDRDEIYYVIFTPASRQILVVSKKARFLVHNADTGHQEQRFDSKFDSIPNRKIFISSSNLIMLYNSLWNYETGEKIFEFKPDGLYTNTFQFSPDAKYVLTQNTDPYGQDIAHLWDINIDREDAATITILDEILGKIPPQPESDVNHDGNVNASDIIRLKRRGVDGTAFVRGLNRSGYEFDTTAPGERVYGDRFYTISILTRALQGEVFIRTLNDDKDIVEDEFLTFEIEVPMTVYVALDDRIMTPPAWMADWSISNNTFRARDPNPGRNLYAKSFPAGTVTLGSNRDENMPTGRSMYSVILVPE